MPRSFGTMLTIRICDLSSCHVVRSEMARFQAGRGRVQHNTRPEGSACRIRTDCFIGFHVVNELTLGRMDAQNVDNSIADSRW